LLANNSPRVKNKDLMKIKDLENKLGTLSKPSKMPGFSFSIPAQKCITGSKLRNKKNSTCSSCYALKGRYVFPNVKDALFNRLDKMNSLGFPQWTELMTELISRKEKKGFFRWHDSGDLQSIEHLKAIVQIARNLPRIKFWLPSREVKIIKDYLNQGETIPENLNIRISAFFIGSALNPKELKRLGCTGSSVGFKGSFNCPSSKQGNQCKECRACWDKKINNVNYHLH
jgi:hypothetical protein